MDNSNRSLLSVIIVDKVWDSVVLSHILLEKSLFFVGTQVLVMIVFFVVRSFLFFLITHNFLSDTLKHLAYFPDKPINK